MPYVHRDRRDHQGRGAPGSHLHFHTPPELSLFRVQCCLTSTETVGTIRDGEPQAATSTFHTAPRAAMRYMNERGPLTQPPVGGREWKSGNDADPLLTYLCLTCLPAETPTPPHRPLTPLLHSLPSRSPPPPSFATAPCLNILGIQRRLWPRNVAYLQYPTGYSVWLCGWCT